jgi:type II secretory pathway pseudopilin PulG/uncharacterized coiled-coil protein SlyX
MNRRTGVTVLEVVIVLVIVATLIALLLPASQSARETAYSRARLIEGLSGGETMLAESAADAEAKLDRFAAKTQAAQAEASVPRKIIYNADVTLIVNDMANAEEQIAKLVKQFDGYVAEAAVNRRAGELLTGQWKVRIPIAHFDDFLEAVSKLGVVESRHQSTQDVTEEFVDLKAQISNKQQLEQRIVDLLKNSEGKIKDVIEVERELARVRGEIERLEGRLRYLTNRTDYTTVTIAVREEHDYVPPTAPTFANRITQAWGNSWQALEDFGQRVAVAAVFALPWIVLAGVLLVPPTWIVARRAAAWKKTGETQGVAG